MRGIPERKECVELTIRQIQHLLGYLGYYQGAVDGIWGMQSAQAASRFQGDWGGLVVDGIVGQKTREALKQAVAAGMPERQKEAGFWDSVRYWSREEFRCRCGGKYCDGFPAEPEETLVKLVDDLRAAAGKPGHASSGLRCRVWNEIQGGVAGSRHLTGKALDFSIEGLSGAQLLALARKDSRTRYAYIIDGGWVHVDVA